ncbi:MAG: terpene cyclase/mutase family protein [Nocardioides sp.]|uniref:prenyltransferase/squalene oxidase repeat-containing protein n=1 Tax=Nocardioides sp. TaxID=35761 RepID=UPI0039E3B0D5
MRVTSHRSVLAGVAVGALAALTLTGCGSTDADSTDADSSTASGTASAAAAASSTGSAESTGSSGSTGSTGSYDTATLDESTDWILGRTDKGLIYNKQYQFDDYSLSADLGLSLAAIGGHAPELATIAKAVSANSTTYLAPGYGTLVSAGSAAKAAVLEQAADAGAGVVGPLVTKLESTVVGSGPAAGRIEDKIDTGVKNAADYANTIGQSLAVRALNAAGSDKAPEATAFLLDQQCSDGGFRLYFSAAKAADQSCVHGSGSSDVDVTAYAVLALAELPDPSAAQQQALDDAVGWLREVQAGDGSFSSAKPVVANSNSTGLAGTALGEVGEATGDADDTAAAEAAARWVSAHVVGCGAAAGAIAYDAAALKTANATGITVKTQGQFDLATAQALPVLQWLPAGAAGATTC